jgi:ketosteroid isomerase-like protein
MTLEEAADRLAIRELIDAYAHCADRRDAKGQMALFTENTAFHVFMDSRSPEPTYILHGRAALAPVFEDLNQYQSTTHFNGQSTIRLEGDRAIGESYCIAHHLKGEWRQSHAHVGIDPIPRSIRQTGWRLVVCRAQTHGRLDRH